MTNSATTDEAEPVNLDLTREQRFIRRLAAGHNGGGLPALHRWHPGQIDPQVIAFTQDADHDEYIAWALTGKAFALFHSGRRDVRYGFDGTGIGRWARRADTSPQTTERIVSALTRAQNPLDVDRQLTALARMNTGGARFSPHWETVLAELVAWGDPARRDDVRFTWARDFNTFTPSSASSAPDIK